METDCIPTPSVGPRPTCFYCGRVVRDLVRANVACGLKKFSVCIALVIPLLKVLQRNKVRKLSGLHIYPTQSCIGRGARNMGAERLDSLLDPSMQENKGTQRGSGSGDGGSDLSWLVKWCLIMN
jgi:hypothetical protein